MTRRRRLRPSLSFSLSSLRNRQKKVDRYFSSQTYVTAKEVDRYYSPLAYVTAKRTSIDISSFLALLSPTSPYIKECHKVPNKCRGDGGGEGRVFPSGGVSMETRKGRSAFNRKDQIDLPKIKELAMEWRKINPFTGSPIWHS